MSEDEYVLEMLCSLPKELLIKKLNEDNDIPAYLRSIDNIYIKSAIARYDDPQYVKMRKKEKGL